MLHLKNPYAEQRLAAATPTRAHQPTQAMRSKPVQDSTTQTNNSTGEPSLSQRKANPIASIAWMLLYAAIFLVTQVITHIALSVISTLFATFSAISTNLISLENAAEVTDFAQSAAANSLASNQPWSILVSSVLSVFFCWLIVRKRGFDAKIFAGFTPTSPSMAFIALVLGIGFSMTFNALVNMPGLEFLQDHETYLAQQHLLGSIWIALAASTAGPIAEEIVFRGFALTELRRGFTLLPSVLIGSVIFGVLHGPAVGWMLMAISFGILFALIALRTRSIYPAITAHIGVNSASFVFIWGAPTQLSTFYLILILGAAILGVSAALMLRQSSPISKMEPAPNPQVKEN